MKTSTPFKDYNTIQKIGYVLVIIAGAMMLANILNILNTSHFVREDLPSYIFIVGGFLMFLPFMTKRLKGMNKSDKATVFLILFFTSVGAIAQDYSKQIAAFEQSFAEKSVTPINEYLSPELKFDPIPVANTPAILNNIVTNLPKLNGITILGTTDGKANVKYDFEGLGVRESAIHFDVDGKFVRIELIENLIQMEIQAQKQRQESVQEPPMTELVEKHSATKIAFKAEDGVTVHGSLYETEKGNPIILLCHQAGYNREEYRDIAPRLNELGYNCLAIDQRSGGDFAGKSNETAKAVSEEGSEPSMADAKADIKAAITYLHENYGQKVIVWGSSYSASLALLEGAANDRVKAIVAFSPGDYFGEELPSLKTVFDNTDKPFWVTSSKAEAEALSNLLKEAELNEKQSQFVPKIDGFHGSRALWTGQKGAEEYWEAVLAFLSVSGN